MTSSAKVTFKASDVVLFLLQRKKYTKTREEKYIKVVDAIASVRFLD